MTNTINYLNKAIEYLKEETGEKNFDRFSLLINQFEENIGKKFHGMDIKIVPFAMQYDFLMACNVEDATKENIKIINTFKEFQQLYDRPEQHEKY